MVGGHLLGRLDEIELIGEALSGVNRGRGGLLLVCGEPGIGKTRLLTEAALEAERLGIRVSWGRCREDGDAPPFLPWLQVLRAAGTGALSPWPEVEALLSPEAPDEPVQPSARFRLLESMAEVIAELARPTGLLLIIDDLHRADRASLTVLEHLASELARLPVLVLGAYRDTDVPPGGHLAGELARVAAAAGAQVVGLRGLEPPDVARLIDAYAGPVGREISDIVADRTDGNPYFVIEVAMVLRGASDQEAVATAAIPRTVAALIADRVAALPPEARRALDAAAVLGRDFGRLPLAAVLESTEIATAAALQPAASTGLISPGQAGTYRFTHALVQSTIYGALTLGGRTSLHRRAAEALEQAGADDDEVLSDLAHHSYCAAVDGDPGPALAHVLVAGRRAAHRLGFDEAVVWFGRALELAERPGVPPADLLEVLLDLAAAERDAGRTASARQHFERAASTARRAGLDAGVGRAALGVGTTVVTAGRVDWDLVSLLQEAVEHAGGAAERARLESRLAIELYWHAGGHPARAMSRSALATAEASEDAAAVGVALHSLQFTLRSPEHLQERIGIGERLVAAAGEAGQLDLEFQGRVWLAADVLRAGDVVRFRELVSSLGVISGRSRLPMQRWYARVMDGQLAAIEGRWDEALRLADEAGALGSQLGTDLAAAYRLGQRCVLLRERGGLAALVPDIEDLSERLPYFVTIRSFAALAAATTGRAAAARLELDRLRPGGFAAVPRDSLWVATVALLTEAAAIAGSAHTAELVALLSPLAGTLVVNGLPNCWGSCDRFLGRANLALGDLARAEEQLSSAATLEAAAGLPVHLARTRLDQARLALAAGDRGQAAERIAAVRLVADDLSLDALDREAAALLPVAGPLSRREEEVLARLSTGETNKEIAAALYISVNTVERHLANIYTKLAVRGRAEAAAWAVRGQHAAEGRKWWISVMHRPTSRLRMTA